MMFISLLKQPNKSEKIDFTDFGLKNTFLFNIGVCVAWLQLWEKAKFFLQKIQLIIAVLKLLCCIFHLETSILKFYSFSFPLA